MPALNSPVRLLKLSLEALCKNINTMVAKATHLTESTDDVLEVAEEEIQVLAKKQIDELYAGTLSTAVPRNPCRAALNLKRVKTLIQKRGDFSQKLCEYLQHLPAAFLNEVFNKVLANIAKIIVYDEEQIENFIDERWSFAPRVRVAFHFLLKSMLFPYVSTLNISPVTNAFFLVLAEYLMKHDNYKDTVFVKEMEGKKRNIFAGGITANKNSLLNLTTLSLQNLADGELLWLISSYCPNLWHLDISGNLFNLQRYCVIEKSAGGYVTAVDKNGRRNYEEAEFVHSVGNLYGNQRISQTSDKYDGCPGGCKYLKTLLLPDVRWEKLEEDILLDDVQQLLMYAPDMEEVTGVCLFYVLCKINEMEYPPIMLKLKKFDGKTGGHSLIGVSPARLRQVRLPFIMDVNIDLNVFMPPVTLEIFPNMKHLTLTPYDYRSYTCNDILPYMKNLHTLDLELTHELSISNMCDIAENCRSLEYLTLTCLALRMQALDLSEDQINKEQLERISSPPVVRMDVKNKKEYEPCKSLGALKSFPEYAKAIMKIAPAPYEKSNSQIPNFSKLHTLQFFDIRSVDAAALYKCIKGSPKIQTLTFVALKKGDNCNIELDDDFVGRIAPLMRRLRDITISAQDDTRCNIVLDKFTGMAIEHLVKFCSDIQSIGTMSNWNITLDEVRALNYCFMKNNYILRLH
ncbi:uncharacterized protein [Procambarus clarkii]|uniref:uncharacterized protein isoform X1 n=1 Tax=Procambarus clarkii TaxID=6728 RepID=UPI001E67329B|nr:uncharacterized protein LOC123759378 [Procambarus clarkii]